MSNPDVHVNFNGETPNVNVEADISPRGAEILASPQTRSVEIETDRGGGYGTSDYEQLENKPEINGVELIGNKSLEDIGAVSGEELSEAVSDLEEAINGKKDIQTAVSDPTASGTAVEFISNISQDTNGVITPLKKAVSSMSGATSSAAGAAGFVPAPAAGDQAKFLSGAGTWESAGGVSDMTGATESTPGVHGLVPAPSAGDQTKFLSGAGTWESVGGASDMTGATESTAGVHGLVPAPAAGDQGKFLKGDGTWGSIPDASGKADKVTNATSGNFAGLDSNGNLTDSGSKASDFATQQAVETLAALPAMNDYNITHTAATNHTYTMGAGRGACLLMVAGSGGSRYWIGYVFRAGASNNLSIGEIAKGSNTSTSVSGGTLTITFDSNTATDARVIHITGEKLT